MHKERYSQYYSIIKRAKEKYTSLLNKTKYLKSFEEKNAGLLSLIEFAVYHNIGIWTSSYIETFYINYAGSIDIENYDIEYTPKSFLHVLTRGSVTGGHTRAAERWISNAPDTQSHSAVFLSPNDDDMSALEQFTKEKNGECIYFDKSLTLEQKALKLRELGMHYEYIILHTHMDDVIPSAAFGTEKFTRPVLLYNHASHMFWLGKSIADLVLDIIKEDEVTAVKKNIKDTFFLGVPSKEIIYSKPDKTALRKKLNLPLNKKIIMSSGTEQKYYVIGNDNYAEIIKKIIDEDTYCYIIGVKKNNSFWKKIEYQSKGHIIPLGYINFNNGYMDYLSAADLYIDSYPVTGYAAMIDAVSRGVPSLSLKSADPQLDYLIKTPAYCLEEEDFISKAKRILNDKNYAEEITADVQKSLEEYQSIPAWNRRIEELLKVCPKKHRVKDLSKEQDYSGIDDLSVLINIMTDKHSFDSKAVIKMIEKESYKDFSKYGINYRRSGVPYIFEVLSYKKSNIKTKVIKIFGFDAAVF